MSAVARANVAIILATGALVGVFLGAIGALGWMNIVPLRSRIIVIEDGSGASRIVLTTLPDCSPKIAMLDSAGGTRAELLIAADGSPMLSLLSADGTTRARVSLATASGDPEITIFDEDGQVTWSAAGSK